MKRRSLLIATLLSFFAPLFRLFQRKPSPDDAFTVATWFKTGEASRHDMFTLGKGPVPLSEVVDQGWLDDVPAWNRDNNGWYHTVVQYDGSTPQVPPKIFVNGHDIDGPGPQPGSTDHWGFGV